MPDIVNSICPFELGADGPRGKYGCIDYAFSDLQQTGPKQYANLDVLLDSNHPCHVENESLEIESFISEDLLENQDSESSDEEEDEGSGDEILQSVSVKFLGDNKYRVNNSRVVQLDHQDLKVEKTVDVVPVHALSTLVSLALRGDSDASEEEDEFDEMDIIKERIDEGFSFEEAADFMFESV